jgi:hypothetical protein
VTTLEKTIARILITIVIALAIPFYAQANTMFVYPSSGEYSVGTTFSARVRISSQAQSVNAVSGTLTFPRDKLSVVSVSKEDSILNLWVQEPSFSNTQGTVNFEGVILGSGFIGTDAKIVTVNFKVLSDGPAELAFSNGSILANDGSGTNIIKDVSGAKFNLIISGIKQPEPAPVAPNPKTPEIFSSTHPDQKKWYKAKDAEFSWSLPQGATEVALLMSKLAKATPIVSYKPPITSKTIENIDDGTWYLHALFKKSDGSSVTSTFKVSIDSTPPSSFVIREIEPNSPYERTSFDFSATDETSAIARYDVSIDGQESKEWMDHGSYYEAPDLKPGKHTITADVYDLADNSMSASTAFNVEGFASPTVDEYTREAQHGDPVVVRGTTIPRATVYLYANNTGTQSNPVSEAKADDKGNFTIIWQGDRRDGGERRSRSMLGMSNNYVFTLDALSEGGVYSNPTSGIPITIKRPLYEIFGTQTFNILVIVVPIISLITILLISIFVLVHRYKKFRKEIKKEVKDVEKVLSKSFNIMREDLRDYVRLLESAKSRRRLTKEEGVMIERMRHNLDDAERVIKKEIEDVDEAV